MTDIATDRLKAFIARIERLELEKADLTASIVEVYSELGSAGFDKKIARKVVALLKMDASDRQEQDAILELYREKLGV